jgi:hypothetical protein
MCVVRRVSHYRSGPKIYIHCVLIFLSPIWLVSSISHPSHFSFSPCTVAPNSLLLFSSSSLPSLFSFPAAGAIQEVGPVVHEAVAGTMASGALGRHARWWLAATCELGSSLLPFFPSFGVRWWLASGDPSPTSSSLLQELEARGLTTAHRGGARGGGWPAATLLPFPSPFSASAPTVDLQASDNPPPLPFSYRVFFFAGAGEARAGSGDRGDACRGP